MTHKSLQRSCIDFTSRQGVASSMPQHVRMDREWQLSGLAKPFYELLRAVTTDHARWLAVTADHARQLRFACFFFGQNTEHVHADAAISWRVDKPDLFVPLLQGLGKLKRLLSRVSLDDAQDVRAVPHAEADRVDHLRSPWREPWGNVSADGCPPSEIERRQAQDKSVALYPAA